jgi:flagellar basal body-associated protein FliL
MASKEKKEEKPLSAFEERKQKDDKEDMVMWVIIVIIIVTFGIITLIAFFTKKGEKNDQSSNPCYTSFEDPGCTQSQFRSFCSKSTNTNKELVTCLTECKNTSNCVFKDTCNSLSEPIDGC